MTLVHRALVLHGTCSLDNGFNGLNGLLSLVEQQSKEDRTAPDAVQKLQVTQLFAKGTAYLLERETHKSLEKEDDCLTKRDCMLNF